MKSRLNELVIRNAFLDERDLIKQFVCRTHTTKSDYRSGKLSTVPKDETSNDFLELFNENVWSPSMCWVCLKKPTIDHPEDIVGCVGVRILADNTVHLLYLYVNTLHRGIGVGRKLVKLIIEWSRCQRNEVDSGYKAITLYTLKGIMTFAIDLYKSEGFRIVEESAFTCFSVVTMKLDLLESSV